MNRDIEGLTVIADCDTKSRRADVVFVHGLGGGSHGTWTHGQHGTPEHFFWPLELAVDLPDCRISTVGYAAGFTGLGDPGMVIEARAGNIAHKLANAGLGRHPIIFVTHSMGGLIVKSLLVRSQTLADVDREQLAGSVRGIVFCATPHRGSHFADAATLLCQVLGGAQKHVQQMRANAVEIDFLHEEFVEWHRRHPIPIESYAESIGLFRKNRLFRPIPLGVVVPRASANTGIAGFSIRDVDADHLTLVKPSNRNHDVYAGVLRFIKQIVENTKATQQAVSDDLGATEPLRQYATLFDRPAFRVPMIFEDVVGEVYAATEDVSAALATGALYGRNGNKLAELVPVQQLRDPHLRLMFNDIQRRLELLRVSMRELEAMLQIEMAKTGKQKIFQMEFFLRELIQHDVDLKVVACLFSKFDQLDEQRNEIVRIFNTQLVAASLEPLPTITLSTRQLEVSREIELNDGKGSQRWDLYYLREHRLLTAALSGSLPSETPVNDCS